MHHMFSYNNVNSSFWYQGKRKENQVLVIVNQLRKEEIKKLNKKLSQQFTILKYIGWLCNFLFVVFVLTDLQFGGKHVTISLCLSEREKSSADRDACETNNSAESGACLTLDCNLFPTAILGVDHIAISVIYGGAAENPVIGVDGQLLEGRDIALVRLSHFEGLLHGAPSVDLFVLLAVIVHSIFRRSFHGRSLPRAALSSTSRYLVVGNFSLRNWDANLGVTSITPCFIVDFFCQFF